MSESSKNNNTTASLRENQGLMLSLLVLRETANSNLPVPPRGRTFPRQLGGAVLSDDKEGGGDCAARNCGVCACA